MVRLICIIFYLIISISNFHWIFLVISLQEIFWQHSLNITRFVYRQKNLYKQHNSFCSSFAAMATRFTLFCNNGLRAILNVRFEASLMCQLKLQGNQRTKLVKSMKYHTFQLTFFCLTKSCSSIVIIFFWLT